MPRKYCGASPNLLTCLPALPFTLSCALSASHSHPHVSISISLDTLSGCLGSTYVASLASWRPIPIALFRILNNSYVLPICIGWLFHPPFLHQNASSLRQFPSPSPCVVYLILLVSYCILTFTTASHIGGASCVSCGKVGLAPPTPDISREGCVHCASSNLATCSSAFGQWACRRG